jgi:hypothetical protein
MSKEKKIKIKKIIYICMSKEKKIPRGMENQSKKKDC